MTHLIFLNNLSRLTLRRLGWTPTSTKLSKLLQSSSCADEHRSKPFFAELVGYIISGPVVLMVLEGEDAVALLRRLCGSTKPIEAAPGTIRGDYAMHTNLNIIHASDSPESAVREIGLFFKPDEILDWKDGNDDWI